MCCSFVVFGVLHVSFSHSWIKADTDFSIEQSIQEKQQSIQDLNSQIDEYTQKIKEKEQEQLNLTNTLEVLENRIAKTNLELEETDAQIDLLNTQIVKTAQDIRLLQTKIEEQKRLIQHVIQQIQRTDQTLPIQLFYGSDRFSQLLDTIQALHQVNTDLTRAVQDAAAARVDLEVKQSEQESRRDEQERLEVSLIKKRHQLEEETEAQTVILDQSQRSEKTFQRLLQEVKQEQIFVQNEIKQLQANLQAKIQPGDALGGGKLMWPVDPRARGVSATFHDPSYPFRNLFEHSGIDLPAPSGTPVQSAAAGYVAWTRRGAQYGNYVMVIHSDGVATLYAHLSRISVVADQFVPRGGQIGLVGSTGFSTGPHLHFEVRKDGIPTDPLNYLPSL